VQVACVNIERLLHTFTGGDAWGPVGALIADGAGNLYGTTRFGGNYSCSSGCGTVFKLAPDGSGGYTESILYSFQGGASDGENPYAGLLLDSGGNLYGTTLGGGGGGFGTVFKLAPNGSGGYAESILYSFNGGTGDGSTPYAGLIMDGAGNLYGTTELAGSNTGGTVFRLAPNGSGGYFESILYSFNGSTGDGAGPYSGVIMDSAGNLYGTTVDGGSNSSCLGGCGTVFKLTPNGSGGYVESVLYSFNGGASDGANPYAGLLMDGSGKLYGTTRGGGALSNGGSSGYGTVFELAPNGSGGYTESVLYILPGIGEGGGAPYAGLTMDSAGNLYGTATEGGSSDCSDGCSTVFKLAPNGSGGYVGTILYWFAGVNDGTGSFAGLIADGAGNLYGTTVAGGNGECVLGCGTVFEISPH
jgi:uncharacterized repeat protein (TIGR03803 family)